ncbi:ESX secretion-associated protein EspG [Amycolatopsis coloradensis]|uniref:ESX secretion-associated protein EspG n=1 Tax=Amycolatopsis coloradensis TaxID=76021 RepID=A0ACD5B521_9PSEU
MANGELLTPVELDFLWEGANAGELPYPLRLRSHGATMDERGALRTQTLQSLNQRRLADERGRPEPHIEDYFGVLARPDLSLDCVQLNNPNTEPLLAVASLLGGQGLLTVQDPRGFHFHPIAPDGLASAIVSLLPPGSRGTEKSITLPLDGLVGASGADFLQRRQPQVDGSATSDEDRKALSRLQAQPRLRGGQFGANARSKHGTRSRSSVLSWFDTQSGRYFTQATRGSDGRDWITVAPADPATLRQRLTELLGKIAAEASPAH